jgi:integrase
MSRPKNERPNFSLITRGDRFYVEWREDGRKKWVSTRTSDRGEARKFLASLVAAWGSPPPPDQPTISKILEGYLIDRKSRVASFATLTYAAAALNRHLADLIPDHLTRERIRAYVKARHREGYHVGPAAARRKKPVSNGTVIREIVTLRAAFKWAVGEKWIATTPTVEAPSAPKARERWLSRDEADKLLAGCHALHIKTFVALALHTAGRKAALLELTWDRVDLTRGRIDLGDGAGNKRRALVPINAKLLPVLQDAWEAHTTDWVVEFGGEQVTDVRTGFAAAVRRAGLMDVTPHALRHTAAAWMVQAGVPQAEVARFLGNSEAMIEKVYGHHSPEFLKRGADALAG